MHTCLRHILLSQCYGNLASAVVTVVEEDNHIVWLDSADCVALAVNRYDRLNELVGYALCVRSLNSTNHIGSLLANAVNQAVVSNLHTLPTLVTVHCIVATDNRANLTCRLSHMLLQSLNKALTTLRVGIATVHKAVYECILNAVVLRDVAQLEQVVN